MFQISEDSIICGYCEHIISKSDRKCRAFKNIPLNIWEGLHDHKTAYHGDGGFLYSPAFDEEEIGVWLNDVTLTIPIYSLICSRCQHYKGGRECKAYPEMIPLEIWLGHVDHISEYPGDRGIRYKKNEGI
jgi:hypothetical protein